MAISETQEGLLFWLSFSLGSISFLSSLCVVYLIVAMKKWNGYIILVLSMTLCQLLYDIANLLVMASGASYVMCQLQAFLVMFGGLSVTLWSNILSLLVFYIVSTIKTPNIFDLYTRIVSVACGPTFILALVGLFGKAYGHYNNYWCTWNHNNDISKNLQQTYYWGRTVSILFNFTIYVLIAKQVARINKGCQNSRGATALATLAQRMKYYPLIQSLCRLGGALDEWQYNQQYESFPFALLHALCSPSTGIGYLLIFLIVQPGAWAFLRSCGKSTAKSHSPSDMGIFMGEQGESSVTSNALHSSSAALSSISQGSSFQHGYTTMDEDELTQIIDEEYSNMSAYRLISSDFSSSGRAMSEDLYYRHDA